MNPDVTFANYRRIDWLRMAGIALVYVVLIRGALKYFSVDGVVGLVYPTTGLSYAILLLTRLRYWPGVFVGELAGNLLSGVELATGLGAAAVGTLEPLAAAWLLTRRVRFDLAMNRPQDFMRLMQVALPVSAVAALCGAAIVWWTSGFTPPQTLLSTMKDWWQSDINAIVLLTPLVLVWQQPQRERLRGWRLIEAVACFGLALLGGLVAYMGLRPASIGAMEMDYWPFLFVTWAAVRFGRRGALLIVLATALQALLGALSGTGPYADDLQRGDLLTFWLYITVLSFVGLMLALSVHDREQALAAQRSSQQRLRFLMTATPVVIYTSKAAGDYGATYISDNVSAVTGYAAREFIDDSGFWLRHLHPEDAPRILADLGARFTHDRHSHEYRFLFKDGTYHWMSAEISLVCDAAGQPVEMVGCWLDITTRKQAEERVHAALREKEVLLKEIYHRVKNNLQVVTSLLDLQGRRATDSGAHMLLRDSANRVASMALMHEQLYRSGDLSSIAFADYAVQLAGHVRDTQGELSHRIPLELDVAPVQLGIETAIPLGLIINELVSNAYKHAFGNRHSGQIVVRLQPVGEGMLELSVSDDGAGLPAGFALTPSSSLGAQLIVSLTEQIGGTLSATAHGAVGTRIAIRFRPDDSDHGRLSSMPSTTPPATDGSAA